MLHLAQAARRVRLLGIGWMVLLAAAMALPARAQHPPKVSKHDVGQVYREARFQTLVNQILPRGPQRLAPLAPHRLASSADTVLAWLERLDPNYRPPVIDPLENLKITRWRLIKRIERFRHEQQFDAVEWSYLGNNYFTSIDTSYTREIRGRMQARYGAPTRTLVELDFTRDLRREEYIQFEYWFVLNDTIPMMIMDVNGPFDRGVVMALEHRYRSILFDLRQSFLGTLMQEPPAPYVDYYYNYVTRRWYRTGYDGEQFFTDPIGHPNLARGRPQLAPQGG